MHLSELMWMFLLMNFNSNIHVIICANAFRSAWDTCELIPLYIEMAVCHTLIVLAISVVLDWPGLPASRSFGAFQSCC